MRQRTSNALDPLRRSDGRSAIVPSIWLRARSFARWGSHVEAIRVAADGGAIFSPSVTRRLIEEISKRARRREPPAALSELTPRELEVLQLVARGLSNAEIAAELVLGEATIKTHVGHLLMKLNLRDRVRAVVLAYETGLAQPGGGDDGW